MESNESNGRKSYVDHLNGELCDGRCYSVRSLLSLRVFVVPTRSYLQFRYTKDLSASTNSSNQSPSPNSTTTNASEPTSAASISSQSKIGLIVGVVGGVLGFLLIIAIVLIIFLYRRLKHQPKGRQKPPERTTAQQTAVMATERQGFGRVSPYVITVPPEASVGTMGSDELNFGDATSPTTTIRTQTTRKGGYISALASLPGLRGNATQWDAPPPSYRG